MTGVRIQKGLLPLGFRKVIFEDIPVTWLHQNIETFSCSYAYNFSLRGWTTHCPIQKCSEEKQCCLQRLLRRWIDLSGSFWGLSLGLGPGITVGTAYVDGWMDGWMDGWVNGWLAEWLDEWMSEWVDGWMAEWIAGWLSRWMDEWMTGWMDG